MPTAALVEIIHNTVASAEREIKGALNVLRADDDRGWNSETLSMIWLMVDAELLRELATRMDALRARLQRNENASAADLPNM